MHKGENDMRIRKLHNRLVLLTLFVFLVFSLGGCRVTGLLDEDDERDAERDEMEDEEEEETEEDKESTEETESTAATQSPETSTPAVQTSAVLTPEEEVMSMIPVLNAITYVLSYESDSQIYDPDNTEFVGSVLYLATQFSSYDLPAGSWVESDEAGSYLVIPYAVIDELAHACFDQPVADITVGDIYGRLTFVPEENVFHAVMGDGMFDFRISDYDINTDGTVELTHYVYDQDEDSSVDGPVAAVIYTLVPNDYASDSNVFGFSYQVAAAEYIQGP